MNSVLQTLNTNYLKFPNPYESMSQKFFLIIAIMVLGLLALSGCVQQRTRSEEHITTQTHAKSEFVTAKLVSVEGGVFVPSAGYYEGELTLSDVRTGKEYSIFVCSKSWDWVKENACYRFSPIEVNKNIEQHKLSSELSGCYVGSLDEVNC